MIYITGDCHSDWRRFATKTFPEQKKMTRDDYVIICGDFGLWSDTNEERYWLKWLNNKPFTTLFVSGNHENYDRLNNEFETKDWHGGKVHIIRENILHLMNGYVFDICDKKIFAFGGARSHDIDDGILDEKDFKSCEKFKTTCKLWTKQGKTFRINHLTWWKEEMPSDEEKNFGLENLAKNGNKVDFIVSHCGPQNVVDEFSCGCYHSDELTEYFNKISGIVDFKCWFFGHYHDDLNILDKYVLLYHQILEIA